jgi:hypothetical protein
MKLIFFRNSKYVSKISKFQKSFIKMKMKCNVGTYDERNYRHDDTLIVIEE